MIHRRTFVAGLGAAMAAATGLLRTASAARPGAVVKLQGIRLGIGPFVAAELYPGRPLPVRPIAGRRCVMLDGQLIGWLPPAAGDTSSDVRLERAGFDASGRLQVFVWT